MPDKESTKDERSEPLDLHAAIHRRILANDQRYQVNAYIFIYEALEYTQTALGRNAASDDPLERHVTGRELLEGIRRYAIEQFGPLAAAVFRSWGVHRTEDFGEIVFSLVEAELMGRTESDSRDDFANGYDFDQAFDVPVKIR